MVRSLSPRVTTYSDAPTHLYYDVLRSMVTYECVCDDVSDGIALDLQYTISKYPNIPISKYLSKPCYSAFSYSFFSFLF